MTDVFLSASEYLNSQAWIDPLADYMYPTLSAVCFALAVLLILVFLFEGNKKHYLLLSVSHFLWGFSIAWFTIASGKAPMFERGQVAPFIRISLAAVCIVTVIIFVYIAWHLIEMYRVYRKKELVINEAILEK